MIEFLTRYQDDLTTEAARIIARDLGVDFDWLMGQIV